MLNKKILYAIVVDAGGAHEAACVYSIWQTHKEAVEEAARLYKEKIPRGCYEGDISVVTVRLGQSYNTWIEA